MSLALAFDASIPPSTPYPGTKAVFGYLGGNTPHVWGIDEWLRFEHLYQMGIWVGYGEDDPVTHAHSAAANARALGWAPNLTGDNRRAIAVDFETEVNAEWIRAYADTVNSEGFDTWVYGSQSTVVNDPARSGRWIAAYNGDPTIPPNINAVAHQYAANISYENTQVDLSVVEGAQLTHFGQGPRH